MLLHRYVTLYVPTPPPLYLFTMRVFESYCALDTYVIIRTRKSLTASKFQNIFSNFLGDFRCVFSFSSFLTYRVNSRRRDSRLQCVSEQDQFSHCDGHTKNSSQIASLHPRRRLRTPVWARLNKIT